MTDTRYTRKNSLRLEGYDYRWPGTYFVTICTDRRENLFGSVLDNKVVLNELGEIVKREWETTGEIALRLNRMSL